MRGIRETLRMATAYRVGPQQSIALRLDPTTFDPRRHRLALRAAGRAYRIDVDGVSDDGWLRIASVSFSFERVVLAHRGEALDVIVTDPGHQHVLATEALAFHQSFFAPLVDF